MSLPIGARSKPALFLLVILLIGPLGASAQQDTTPPVLVEFSFAPNPIDVTESDGALTCTARIKDDLAGYDDGGIGRAYFRSPSGLEYFCQFRSGFRTSGDEFATLISSWGADWRAPAASNAPQTSTS